MTVGEADQFNLIASWANDADPNLPPAEHGTYDTGVVARNVHLDRMAASEFDTEEPSGLVTTHQLHTNRL